MKRFRIVATVTMVFHVVVGVVHDLAHRDLGIELTAAQTLFINLVILAAPVVAIVLLWSRFKGVGAILFASAMAASLSFGLCYHYVLVSPDHLSHLPDGDLQALFRITALLLALVQALGAAVGIWGVVLGREVRR
jgi:hypothetical protein